MTVSWPMGWRDKAGVMHMDPLLTEILESQWKGDGTDFVVVLRRGYHSVPLQLTADEMRTLGQQLLDKVKDTS